MRDIPQVCKNIRYLRTFFGETQEGLGFALGFNNNTISNYERGRIPDAEKLSLIASYFRVSVDELLTKDYSYLEYDKYKCGFLLDITETFPIVSSARAMENTFFSLAYNSHQRFYDGIKNWDEEKLSTGFQLLDINFELYQTALEDDSSIKAECAANLIAIFCLDLSLFAAISLFETPSVIGSSALKELNKEREWHLTDEEEIYTLLCDVRDAMGATGKVGVNDIVVLNGLVAILKETAEWASLGDYYMAQLYMLGAGDINMGRDMSGIVGKSLMTKYAAMGNTYAIRYIERADRTVDGTSQIVKDK